MLRTLLRLAGGAAARLSLLQDGLETVLADVPGAVTAGSAAEVGWDVADRVRARLRVRGDGAAALAEVLREALAPVLVAEMELGFFTRELAARYEEVELLTSAGETLASLGEPEGPARRLLASLVRLLRGAEGEIWTVPEGTSSLARLVAVGHGGPDGAPGGAGLVHDVASDASPLALCCREGEPRTGLDVRAEQAASVPWLAVPLRNAGLRGAAGALGVLRIRRHPGGPAFHAREIRFASAVASQLAAALESRRFLLERVERERMQVELDLAHDLQLRLLPDPADFRDLADVAARCVPAESVGGDFYQLLRLGDGRLGVMLGDVSSHGYAAGLIMALTMSAASLVARDADDPGTALAGVHRELLRRLESTEMYMTLCYAVLDPTRGRLRYANAGHPHAWRVRGGEAVRLEALGPPLGLAEREVGESRELEWRPDEDVLVLFTDGLGECLNAGKMWGDDLVTETVARLAGRSAEETVAALFALACAPVGGAADDRTAVVVR
ncbi:MAG: SpoIIE family protein phosphatase [Gemmatimonadota bacterium]|nr:SpoIIE family protein phosphatase [Gemmatimonadota bacterium]